MSRERAQALLTSNFGPWGPIHFPYVKMGNIDSLHLFGDTELMIMAMYWHNRKRWNKVLDIGANIGLHSVLMSMLGFDVIAFEPDPVHYDRALDNVLRNGHGARVRLLQAAVHTRAGEMQFVRVLNNLTGNHLVGYKDSYGPKETITVKVVDCRLLWGGTDFAKIDSEGNEADLCLTMTPEDMSHMQTVLEVRNEENAKTIYDHFTKIQVPMWSQKRNWQRVSSMDDMPLRNRDGSLFVGHRGPFDE